MGILCLFYRLFSLYSFFELSLSCLLLHPFRFFYIRFVRDYFYIIIIFRLIFIKSLFFTSPALHLWLYSLFQVPIRNYAEPDECWCNVVDAECPKRAVARKNVHAVLHTYINIATKRLQENLYAFKSIENKMFHYDHELACECSLYTGVW